MKNEIYLNCKSLITEEAKCHKGTKDKPYQRECLNNLLDDLLRQLDFHHLRDKITKPQQRLYSAWLTNYTIKLHLN